MLLSPRIEPGWMAFVPQGEHLRVAQVTSEDGRPRVRWTWEGSWKPGDRRATLLALHKAHPARVAGVWLLERGQYQLMTTEAPADLPREEWRDALRWQLKDQVDFDVADAAIDLLSVPGNQQLALRREPLLAVLTPRAPLRPLVALLEEARFRLKAIDIPDTALRNLCGRCEPEGRAQAMLSFGGGHGHLVITHQGELLTSRQIDLSAELLTQDDDARREAAIDRCSLEVQRTLDSFERVHSHVSLARLLTVPGPGMAALAAHLRQFVAVPVEVFDIASVLDAGDALQGAAAAPWLLALGTALRENL
ncbi:agglutinin biogenesis protein MshI [Inhella sp.]|uniref:agglutinin biogenesis protein MshI n=1 Tax=Inhella sp. TaxID=1921806 RepID=UPI0035B46FA1